MTHSVEGTQSVLGRVVSAGLRSLMAVRRVSGKQLAAKAGMSQNYLATRLRDEKPFTLDDVDVLLVALDAFDFRKDVDDILIEWWNAYSESIGEELFVRASYRENVPVGSPASVLRPAKAESSSAPPLRAVADDQPDEPIEADQDDSTYTP